MMDLPHLWMTTQNEKALAIVIIQDSDVTQKRLINDSFGLAHVSLTRTLQAGFAPRIPIVLQYKNCVQIL